MHRSPPLGLLASLFAALVLAASVAQAGQPEGLQLIALLQVCASIPLGLFTVVFVSRLLFLRINVAGIYVALFGGLGASLLLLLSGLATWIASDPDVASDFGAQRVVTLLAFATGGFGYTAALGWLLAGIAVPSLVFKLMPRWAGWSGLVVAGLAELSLFGMLVPEMLPLVGIARFPALAWIVIASFVIPRRRLMTFDRLAGVSELPTMRTRLEGA